MSEAREPNRPPALLLFAVGVLAKSYEDIRSWGGQAREEIARIPDEIKKIPVSLASLPLHVVTDAVASAIRMQQNFNAMVIKGDETLEAIFRKPEEQASWATFDEDLEEELPVPAGAARPPRSAPEKRVAARVTAITEAKTAPTPKLVASAPGTTAKPSAKKPVGAKPSATKPTTPKPDSSKPTTPKPATPKPASPGATAKPSEPKPPATKPTAAKPTTKTPAPKATAKPGVKPELVEYLDYDALTLAQLRARARNLSVSELKELLAYERETTNRPPFLTLLENRIAASGS